MSTNVEATDHHPLGPPVTEEERKLLLEAYQANFDRVVHEFNLLHNRTNHFISFNWMIAAVSVAVLVSRLGKWDSAVPSWIAVAILFAMSSLGLWTAYVSRHGVAEAVEALKMHLKNQRAIERHLGDADPFLRRIGLNRRPSSFDEYEEHQRSLTFHRFLHVGLGLFWLALLGAALFFR